MEATRSEYLLASTISSLVRRAKRIEHHDAIPEYKYPERYTLEVEMEAVDLLIRFCNEYAASIDSDLWIEVPTEDDVFLANERLKARLNTERKEG